ncbi:ribosome small subunit-dependent GTPase A [bacterium]|nr:MAG: ribosome small subunit-dependent GTPase A [bacterium]
MIDGQSGLDHLGFSRYLSQLSSALDVHPDSIARVIAEHKGAYDVATADRVCRAVVTTKRITTATGRDDFPAVGDWVVLSAEPAVPRIIDVILPRVSTLHKQYGGKTAAQLMVANADVAFIVESTDRDYSPNRFERYVVLVREGGVMPVLVLNKADKMTAADLAERVNELKTRFEGIEVLVTSSTTDTGLDQLIGYLEPGLTYCLLGSSGVGKSTIINKLLENDAIRTQDVSTKSDRGRHTTTGRALYTMDSGTIIIDNPGSREVGVTDAQSGIVEVFDDIETLTTECRFTNCAHTTEPGCAVLQALNDGQIEASHYENFLKLAKEAAHFAATAEEKRQKDKKFGKMAKTMLDEVSQFKPR